MVSYDRAYLLHGEKRDEILTLQEVHQYGADSFNDPDYVSLYGMKPAEWYSRGIRLLGRTAVECTRDVLADRVGRDIAAFAAALPGGTPVSVVDPFAGSCNTLYWTLRHVPNAGGVAFECDAQVHALTARNIAGLDRRIRLLHGDYAALLDAMPLPPDHALIVFVAPPWGTALDEAKGLDLRRTEPPITEIIDRIIGRHGGKPILFATQVYEKVNPESLADLKQVLDWSDLRVYKLLDEGRNHGILLGATGWPKRQAVGSL